MVVEYKVDPDSSFQKSLNQAYDLTGDLTIPLGLITKRWYQSNKSIFALKGKGKYEDLKPRTKKFKLRHIGQVYPILLLSGTLAASITEPQDGAAFNEIVNKKILLLGVRTDQIKYARAHQFGNPGNNLPARPFLLTGAEQVANAEQKKSLSIYNSIVQKYIMEVLKRA